MQFKGFSLDMVGRCDLRSHHPGTTLVGFYQVHRAQIGLRRTT
jgi:hypothetical protein